MPDYSDSTPRGWLAFELSVLRRLRFRSLVNPFAGEPDLETHVKRWGVRVAANDTARWSWIKSIARVENNGEQLSADDLDLLLEDVYVPRHKLRNPALRRWFGETDAWWFDNLRQQAEKLDGEIKQSLALNLGMLTGDYALSFDEDTRELRQPLSRVLRRLHESQAPPFDNGQPNTSANKDARQFIAEQRAELLFLRLPAPARHSGGAGVRNSLPAWREEWVRGGAEFWDEFEASRAGRLGGRVETKQQYLRLVEELLEAAAHFKAWAIAHTEGGYTTTEELVETIRRVRKVETIYTKDFSELLGARATIITT
ncbi:MAG TPA: hypothetical protein VGX24_10655 [Pyrinomonadaceae bacterium]|jgi:hypothetical protein|nr:hypothetical protein [Pyrinomonadaceae bacterium]